MRLASIISRIDKHKRRAKELGKSDLSNDVVFSALAMECFQAVNSAIDLGEFIVSEKNLGFPSKYKEIFELLHDAKIIGRETLDAFKRLIFLRNLISHEYYTISQEELKEMAQLLERMDELIRNAKVMGD
jgi:uncharacterized protein YutE (UPF0331/DUF86 family)